MKAQALFFLFSCMAAEVAEAQEWVAGSMHCEVKSNSITAINDGQVSEFSAISEGFRTGDILRFLYFADPTSLDLGLYLAPLPSDEEPILGWSSVRSLGGTRMTSAPMTDTGNGLVSNDLFYSMTFSEDYIRFDNGLALATGAGTLTLERYFRTDWHGLGRLWVQLEGQDMALQVFTLDCRQVEERFDDVMTVFEGISRARE